MTELILLNNNERITIDEKYGVAVENNIADIRDLERVTGGSSKSLYITGNEEVNTTLGSLFNINFESQTFDIRNKQECELWSNNERLIKGFFQIIEIDYNAKNQYTYEVMVFDEQINFFLEIEENLITGNDDPSKDLDFSQYNHLWTKENVQDSWTKNPMELPYYYALFDQSKSFVVNVDDYKPGFYLYSLIEQIFYKYGYRFESEFLESDLFKEIFIPFSTGDGLPTISDDDEESRLFRANNDTCVMEQQSLSFSTSDKPYSSTFLDNVFQNTIPFDDYGGGSSRTARYRQFVDFHNVVFENTTGLIDPGSGAGFCLQNATNTVVMPKIVPIGNNKQNIKLDLEFDLTLTNEANDDVVPFNSNFNVPNQMYIFVDLLKVESPLFLNNGQIWLGNNDIDLIDRVIIDVGDMPNLAESEVFNTVIQRAVDFEGVQLYNNQNYIVTFSFNRCIWRKTIGINLDGPVSTELKNTKVNISNEIIKSDVQEGDTINLNQWLPQNFKQKDLLKGVFKMFNLKMMPDPDDEKKLIIEPRDKFYTMGDVINANEDDNFYVLDKPSKYKLVTDFQAKEIIFKYKDDSDSDEDDRGKRQLLDYKNEFKREYGEQRILFDNENLRQQRIIELPFASTIPARASQNPWNGNIRQYFCGLIDAKEPKNAPRILFKNVIDIEDAIVWSEGDRNQEMRQFVFSPGQETNTTNGIPVRQTETDFVATGTHFRGNNPSREPTFDLNFGRTRKLYSPFRTATDDNLYNTFWSNEISNIDDQRMLTAYFYISNDRYRRLKINDIIYFDKNEYSNYYIINRIVEYNAKTGEAKLELLTFDPDLTFRPTRPVDEIDEDLVIGDQPIEPNIDIGSDNDNSGGVISIGNNNINKGSGSIVTGNENINLGESSDIRGEKNINYSKQTTIKGDDNFIGDGSKGSTIVGNNNEIINGAKAFVFGNGQTIESDGIYFNNQKIGFQNQEIKEEDSDVQIPENQKYTIVTANDLIITLPEINSDTKGVEYIIKNANVSNTLIETNDSNETIDGVGDLALVSAYDSVRLVNDGDSNWYIV